MLKLIVLVKPMIIFMATAVFLGVLGFICACSIPILGSAVIMSAFGILSLPIKILFVMLIVLGVMRGILHYGEQACNHYIAFRLLAIIRDMVFGALRRLCPAKLEGRDKGNLISLITSDVELLEVFYAHTISPIIIGIICSLIFSFFTFKIHPLLGLISILAYIAVGFVIPVLNGKRVNEPGMEYRNKSGELNSLFLESLRGLRELIQYGKTTQREHIINEKTASLAHTQDKLKKYEYSSRAFTDITIYAFDIAMLFVSLWLYEKGAVSFDNSIVAVVTLMSTYGPVTALSNLSNTLAQTLASGERVLSLLEEEPETEENANGTTGVLSDILCQDVSFGYGGEKIISDISIYAKKGSVTGIHGKSGCGKSTLLKLIMRFWDKDSGKILLSGNEIKDINTHCLRQNESYCTQETHLFNDTIGNNIKISNPNAKHEEVVAAAKAASIDSFISELPLGYNTPIGELGGRLSSGEKQRIGIARAFLSPANIMLLDEPTSNLDILNEGIILKSLNEVKDKTIILVSHRKSTLSIADKVYSIEGERTS